METKLEVKPSLLRELDNTDMVLIFKSVLLVCCKKVETRFKFMPSCLILEIVLPELITQYGSFLT